MAVVIDSTVGGSASNSFATLAESETYMESRLNGATWTAATTDNKNRALVEATREISALTDWNGDRVTDTQSLAWPRMWAQDPHSANGWYLATTTIPQNVKDATMELAFQFLKAGTTDLAVADSNTGVIEKTIDVLTTRWESARYRKTGLGQFERVFKLLAPYRSGVSGQINLVRG